MALSDNIGLYADAEEGTLATAIYDACVEAKAAAGEGVDSDPDLASKKFADLLSDAIYNFALTARIDTFVETTVSTAVVWDASPPGSVVLGGSAGTDAGDAVGEGTGDGTGTGIGGPDTQAPGIT